jgi:hypothetical protein
LGTAVTAYRAPKFKSTTARFEEARETLEKIMQSELLTIQKVDAVKTFVLPMFDFMLLNGEVEKRDLKLFDQHVRGLIDKELKVRGLPVACHHASWRDGGISYPSLVDRGNVLTVRSFTQMALSKDEKVNMAMRTFIEDERKYRKIEVDEDSIFLNWEAGNGRRSGTDTITIRTRKACEKMKIGMKLDKEEVKIKKNGEEKEWTAKNALGLGRVLTQNVIRKKWAKKLQEMTTHGASYITLENDKIGNAMLKEVKAMRSDAFYRFTVAARADCLPTPNNIRKWFGGEDRGCRSCGTNAKQTLFHILNDCRVNYPLMTKRHNKIVDILRKEVEKRIRGSLETNVEENRPMTTVIDGLSEETRVLRPDLWFKRRGEGGRSTWEIIDVTCPYGRMAHEENTLKRAFDEKQEKYECFREIEDLTGEAVRITPIVISSLGAVYEETIGGMENILGCTRKEAVRIGKRMAVAAISGSMQVWRQHMERVHRNKEANRERERNGEPEAEEEQLENRELEIAESVRENELEEVSSDDEGRQVRRVGRRRRRVEHEPEQEEVVSDGTVADSE